MKKHAYSLIYLQFPMPGVATVQVMPAMGPKSISEYRIKSAIVKTPCIQRSSPMKIIPHNKDYELHLTPTELKEFCTTAHMKPTSDPAQSQFTAQAQPEFNWVIRDCLLSLRDEGWTCQVRTAPCWSPYIRVPFQKKLDLLYLCIYMHVYLIFIYSLFYLCTCAYLYIYT